MEESVGALADLRAAGMIRLIGLSNVTVEQLAAAQAITPIASVQNRYNLADRGAEDVLRECERQHLAFLPWGPLGGSDHGRAAAALAEVGAAHGGSGHAAALAWLLGRSPMMLPIPGTADLGHLDANIAAASIELDAAERDRLDAFTPMLGTTLDRTIGRALSPQARRRVSARARRFRRAWRRLRNG